MTAREVILEYRRDGAFSTGRLLVGPYHLGDAPDDVTFVGLSFSEMLFGLARLIEGAVDPSVIVRRTDRAGLVPYALDPGTVRLLQSDPVAAVAAMTYHGSPSTSLLRREEEARLAQPHLRVATELLSDVLGDLVYARVREHDLECPGCGFWMAMEHADPLCLQTLVCKKCGITTTVEIRGAWGAVPVTELLRSDRPHFFLPRAWNPTPPFVARQELERLYQEFVAERETFLCSIKTVL